MKFIFSILLFCFCSSVGQWAAAQEESVDSTGVVVHADPRLALVTASIKIKNTNSGGRSGVIRSGRGFRVQIYNGNDRNKATMIKVNFMRRFPQIPTYMSYIQPQFRVKVGNFRSRADAQKFLQQVTQFYSPVMVVPDIIVINTFKDDQ